jgi:predicted HicB family RNase H-like nuclease
MADKSGESLPEDLDMEGASAFWDTHSVADFPSTTVELEYTPEGNMTFVAIDHDLSSKLDKKAKARGISVETLVNLWLQEKLEV